MLLLTWHGTILRVEQAQNRLSHAPPVPVRDIARDLQVAIPTPLTAPAPIGAGMELVPADRPGTVHLRRANASASPLYVAPDPDEPFPACDQPTPPETAALLPLPDSDAETLRRLLSGIWRNGAATTVTPRLATNFKLTVGPYASDLLTIRPETLPNGDVRITFPEGKLTLTPQPVPPPLPDLPLRPAPVQYVAVPNPAALHAAPGSRLIVHGPNERAFLPLTASRADTDWLYAADPPPEAGARMCAIDLIHDQDVCVLRGQSVDGTILHAEGLLTPAEALAGLRPPFPPPLAREADTLFVAATALRDAPLLPGPHALFHNHAMLAADGWLLGAVLPLAILHPLFPPGTRLLLPATLTQFQRETLALFGLDALPVAETAAPLVRVEHLYRPDRTAIENIPAVALNDARGRILRALPPPGPRRRLYLRDPGANRAANTALLEVQLAKKDFETLQPETLSLADQILLFRNAEFIVSPHAPVLANTIFCQPGTKVLEIAPRAAYSGRFANIASKLGLVHAVLPCGPSPKAEAQPGLHVDAERLWALMRMLQSRM
jgi:hypothetical protein